MKNLIALVISFMIGTAAFSQIEKRVEKSFESANFTGIKITNSFGDIDISPQKSSKIEVEIVLSIESKNDKRVQEYLDNTEFIFVEKGKTLEITTRQRNKNFKWSGKLVSNLQFTLKVPENLNMDILNTFGDVRINGTTGKLRLNLQHGDCFIASANGSENDLMVLFGDLRIESMNKSKIIIEHGDLKINKIDDLDLNVQFSDVYIDLLGGANEFKIGHSDLKIYDVSSNLSAVKIEVQFGDVTIAGLSQHNIDMDLLGTFAKYSFDKSWKLANSSKGINDVHYNVKSGSGTDHNKLLTIAASHSNVKLK